MNPIADADGILKTSPETCAIIAHLTKYTGRAFISWTDEEGSHLDILFVMLDGGLGSILAKPQGGIRHDYLFVSVMRVGAFAFNIDNQFTHPNTYIEKLTMPPLFQGSTANKLADLINGVKLALVSLK